MTSRSNAPVSLLMIGDDLSGTADCAVTCAAIGLASVVGLGVQAAGGSTDAAVLAIDTDTRRAAAADAARATVAVWHAHGAGRKLYKKIDSTLRGNVTAEIAALVGAGMAIVAPAFPAAGRTTVGGRQFVFGVPVEASEVWRNEALDGKADLIAMLASASLRVAHADLTLVRGGADALNARLQAWFTDGIDAVVCDSESDEDLRAVADASARLEHVYWVGSAGLAAPLVATLAGFDDDDRGGNRLVESAKSISTGGHADASSTAIAQAPTATLREIEGSTSAHPRGVLVVVGSMSSVSHGQIDALQRDAGETLERVDIDAATLLDPVSAAALTLTARVSNALLRGRHVIVALSQAQRAPLADGALLARRLADHLAPAARNAAGLVATGGETARALLSALGVTSLRVIDEIETGVPRMAALDAGRLLPVVTKAGGFGRPDSLSRAWRALAATRAADTSVPQEPLGETTMTYRPVIGITMGDAAGVGPEIIMKSLAHESVYETCRPLVIGDAKRLVDAGRRAGVSLTIRSIASPAEAQFRCGEVDCIDLALIPDDLPYGKLSSIAGDAAYQYIARTVELTSKGELDAICTAPLNKEALHAGGHIFPGHTEMLAHLTGIPEVSMMLVAPKLRVIHVTTHIGLIDAIRKIEPGLVQRTIERAQETLVRAGIEKPRIGVCGINPHAGENGLFGYGEEEEKIIPAVKVLRERGLDVEGPLPADTLFFRAGRGDFDVVVAMYHDQGHGPVKVMGLEAGVNVTVGLPVIRTSVDHGTAFDIAGKGIADERSMLEALKQARDLATRRAVQTV
ncbi:4-hydroxythreonine-4-phosphate dehydrogenase PdxA [Trinickia dinghuensis]|uniref:4-hydroxythreonine-4-phosphate dehydrogenase PdxA n=1 Tax=Trinickia dinghuensis TaxID=2291023 RepID=A0A3D8K226_9BURK|nr:4-hydroxythreonine-4-phosphate dehydrogenase PdxA [Trinickia dinghuensis]RDU99493.1 4-hydroxythreonine-4-phosphate dehydrogenase PdxA [Trinickia dinghuensis]